MHGPAIRANAAVGGLGGQKANGGCEIADGFVVAARSFVRQSGAGDPARIIGRTGDRKAYAEVRQTDVLLGARRRLARLAFPKRS